VLKILIETAATFVLLRGPRPSNLSLRRPRSSLQIQGECHDHPNDDANSYAQRETDPSLLGHSGPPMNTAHSAYHPCIAIVK
jgi:hypothetical protein